MNSFKPLTVYKGFVVPEEYASGAIDAFDAVTYLQQIGLKKEAEQFFVTLKTVKVPKGFTVTNKESNIVYGPEKDIPVTFADGKDVNNWDDFMAYAQDEPQWDIQEGGVEEETDEQSYVEPSEETIGFLNGVEVELQKFISDKNFDAAKEYLEEAEQATQNFENESDYELSLGRLKILRNIVEAFEKEQLENEAGLDTLNLPSKEKLTELVSTHDEVYVTFTKKEDKFLLETATKKNYHESYDLGLIASTLNLLGLKDAEQEVLNAIQAFKENSNKKINLYLDSSTKRGPKEYISLNLDSSFGFLPENIRQEFLDSFLEKFAQDVLHTHFDYSVAYNPHFPPDTEKITKQNNPIIKRNKQETDEEKQIRRAGELLEFQKLVQSFSSGEGTDVSQRFAERVDTAKKQAERIQSHNRLVSTMRQENIAKQDFNDELKALKYKFFKNGRDLYLTLVELRGGTAKAKEEAQRLLNKHFKLKNNETGEVIEGFEKAFKHLTPESFNEWSLVPKKNKVYASKQFSIDVRNFLYRDFVKKLRDAGVKNASVVVESKLDSIKAVAYLFHQNHYSTQNDDYIEKYNLSHSNELLSSLFGNEFSENFFSRILSNPNDSTAYLPINLLAASRFLPWVPGQNKLNYDEETRQKLLEKSGLKLLNYGTEIFDNVSENAGAIIEVLNYIHNEKYLDNHERHLSHLTKRLVSHSQSTKGMAGNTGETIVSSGVVKNSKIEVVDSAPADFDSPESIEREIKEIFTEDTFQKLTNGTEEEIEEAKNIILTNFENSISAGNLAEEDKQTLLNYVNNVIDTSVTTYGARDSTVGQSFEEVSLIPIIAVHAKNGSMRNVKVLDPETNSFVDNDFVQGKKVTEGFHGTKGLSWNTPNSEGEPENIHVLGGPKSTGGAGDAFYTKLNPSSGEAEHTTLEIKQEKGLGSVGHIGATTKMLNYIFDTWNYISKLANRPDVTLKFRPSYNISMPHGGDEISVDRINNSIDFSNNASYTIRGVISAVAEKIKKTN